MKESPETITADVYIDGEYYLTIKKPFGFHTKETYSQYEDKFGNKYYEPDFNYDSLKLLKEQNEEINQVIAKLKELSWEVDEESL